MATDIETFYASHKAVVDFLIANKQPSFASDTNNNFRRSLILAIASSFEHEITEIVAQIPHVYAQGNPMVVGLIEQKVIPRQYHTYFDWDKKNANKFFAMFGGGYAELAKTRVGADAGLDQAVKNFLALGDTRNRLVHLDYVNFDIEKSPDDIIAMFRSAQKFVTFLRVTSLKKLSRYQQPSQSGAATPKFHNIRWTNPNDINDVVPRRQCRTMGSSEIMMCRSCQPPIFAGGQRWAKGNSVVLR